MRSRFFHRSVVMRLFVLLAAAAVLEILASFNMPCVWKTLFGIPCPGCGMVHAFLSLMRLDFAAAFSYHPMVFAMPLLVLFFLSEGPLFFKKADRVMLWLILAGFLINWGYQIVLFTR